MSKELVSRSGNNLSLSKVEQRQLAPIRYTRRNLMIDANEELGSGCIMSRLDDMSPEQVVEEVNGIIERLQSDMRHDAVGALYKYFDLVKDAGLEILKADLPAVVQAANNRKAENNEDYTPRLPGRDEIRARAACERTTRQVGKIMAGQAQLQAKMRGMGYFDDAPIVASFRSRQAEALLTESEANNSQDPL